MHEELVGLGVDGLQASSCRGIPQSGTGMTKTDGFRIKVIGTDQHPSVGDLYPVLNEPDGRVYLSGEHLSFVTAWQEGAVLSAHRVVESLHARVHE